jgi:hypothetical protein
VFSRIAIVNRGEAAMRLIHAVRELNAETGSAPIETIALYTDGERTATFVREADDSYCLGPASARPYLDHGIARSPGSCPVDTMVALPTRSARSGSQPCRKTSDGTQSSTASHRASGRASSPRTDSCGRHVAVSGRRPRRSRCSR